MKAIILSLFIIGSAMAFEPVYVEAQSFTNKVSNQYSRHNNPSFCRFETKLDSDKKEINLRLGVVGSPIDYFGWNAPIALQDFPLQEGFKKIFKTPGVTAMIMTYEKGILKFERLKGEKVWNRLYPFEIQIDNELKTPKFSESTMEGYEVTTFGQLKKHVVQSCKF